LSLRRGRTVGSFSTATGASSWGPRRAVTLPLPRGRGPTVVELRPPLPSPLLQRRRGCCGIRLTLLEQRGVSPSPPLEERAGERRPFARLLLNSPAVGRGQG